MKNSILHVLFILGFIRCESLGIDRDIAEALGGINEVSSFYVIHDINVIPIEPAGFLPEQSVFIEKGRIIKIVPTKSLSRTERQELKRKYLVIDGAGRFLVPGFIDAHVHIGFYRKDEFANFELPLYVANGVTTVRNMAGVEYIVKLKKAVEKKEIVGPRIFSTGPIYNGSALYSPTDGDWCYKSKRWNCAIKTPAFASERVSKDKTMGFDAIKTRDGLSREAYLALYEAAKKHNLPLVGHYPEALPYEEVFLKKYQRSIDHPSSFGPFFESANHPFIKDKDLSVTHLGIRNHFADPKKEDQFVAAFAKSGIYFVPTLDLWRNNEQGFRFHAGMENTYKVQPEYMDSCQIEKMASYKDDYLSKVKFADMKGVNYFQLGYKAIERLVYKAWKAGVPIVTGTDHYGYVIAGFSIHDEMDTLAQAGIPLQEVLRAATLNAAQMLELQDVGVIKAGSIADLVILNSNPLENIKNTNKIYGVFLNGRWFDRGKLYKMLIESGESIRNTPCNVSLK